MCDNTKNTYNDSNKSVEIKATDNSNLSLNEKWEQAIAEVRKKDVEASELFIAEELANIEFAKKYGKEPKSRMPDGKINQKYIDYILKRDFGIDPDSNYIDPYENFSWGGLRGIEAYIAKMNCE